MRHKGKSDTNTDQAMAVAPAGDSGGETPVRHEDIALLAYSYWEAHGGGDGSADQDWLRAERELRRRASRTSHAAAA
ncbi:MAG: DUF2934 domain-containing protein [Acidobacteria bacterium]|nr:DUF2934 domain-containing protein [Acidobacteriota bacterium]MBI3279051.1 DUF2934 domain-containing protein [Acidobacteriota bacterium]